MSKGLIISISINIVLLIVVGLLSYLYTQKPDIKVVQQKIEWKPLKRDLTNKTKKEIITDYSRYLTEKPILIVEQDLLDPYTININAGLCERKWSTKIKVRVKYKPKKNIISAGIVLFTEVPRFNFHYGIKLGYYRFLKPIYMGADLIVTRNIENNYGVGVYPTIAYTF